MKIGTIDIGTNSMRLLTADYQDGKIINRKKYILYYHKVIVFLLKQ